jgi:hypothetical protein
MVTLLHTLRFALQDEELYYNVCFLSNDYCLQPVYDFHLIKECTLDSIKKLSFEYYIYCVLLSQNVPTADAFSIYNIFIIYSTILPEVVKKMCACLKNNLTN